MRIFPAMAALMRTWKASRRPLEANGVKLDTPYPQESCNGRLCSGVSDRSVGHAHGAQRTICSNGFGGGARGPKPAQR